MTDTNMTLDVSEADLPDFMKLQAIVAGAQVLLIISYADAIDGVEDEETLEAISRDFRERGQRLINHVKATIYEN